MHSEKKNIYSEKKNNSEKKNIYSEKRNSSERKNKYSEKKINIVRKKYDPFINTHKKYGINYQIVRCAKICFACL